MEICTVGSVRGESTGKHAGAFSYSEGPRKNQETGEDIEQVQLRKVP
jgi:hypothetical protein